MVSISIATAVGQIVSRPCSPYHLARAGSSTRTITFGTLKRRFEVDRVVVRVLDPARARWYAEQGLQTVCPTQTAIELLEAAVRGQIRFEGVSG